jgi:hypothetical protein
LTPRSVLTKLKDVIDSEANAILPTHDLRRRPWAALRPPPAVRVHRATGRRPSSSRAIAWIAAIIRPRRSSTPPPAVAEFFPPARQPRVPGSLRASVDLAAVQRRLQSPRSHGQPSPDSPVIEQISPHAQRRPRPAACCATSRRPAPTSAPASGRWTGAARRGSWRRSGDRFESFFGWELGIVWPAPSLYTDRGTWRPSNTRRRRGRQ